MKEGWTYKKLGEVCDFEGGSQPPKSEWIITPREGYIRMLQIRDFTKSRNTNIEYVKLSKKLRICKEDDILIGRYGASVGKILTGLAGAYNVAIIKSIPDEGIILKRYIKRYFESSLFQNILFKVCSSRAAQAGFSKEDIYDSLIPVPPLPEQRAIVARLDSAFAQIDALKANAERQLSEARKLFQKALEEAMTPKEGWEEKTLGDVCEIKSFLVNPNEEQYKNLLHVGGANIVSLTGELIDLKTAEEEGLESGKFTFDENDVLYNKIRPYLIKVAKPDFYGLCSADMYPLKPKESIIRDYLYYVLISKDFTEYAILNSGRAGMPKVNRQALFAYRCLIPPLSTQRLIVARLDSLSSHVRALEDVLQRTKAECDALKQAMLRAVFE